MQLGAFMMHSKLAEGGMGEVWTGTHSSTGTPVAIKVLTGRIARERSFQDHFQKEVQATARLRHPNVISIFDCGFLPEQADAHGLAPGSPYYVMEFIEGGSLAGTPWDYATLRHALLATLGGLAHSHARGILHLDIKPPNVLRASKRGGLPRIVVTDFGLAEVQERIEGLFRVSEEDSSNAAGTPPYMAPEQFLGAFRDFGPWTDLYAVGIMAFEAAAGRLPFNGPTVIAYAQQHTRDPLPQLSPRFPVPDGFEVWLNKISAKNRRDRFLNAAQAARALDSLGLPPKALTPDGGDIPDPLEDWTEAGGAETIDSWDAPTRLIYTSEPPELVETLRSHPAVSLDSIEALIPDDWRAVSDQWVQSKWLPPGLELIKWRTPPIVARESERDLLWKSFLEVVESDQARAVIIRGRLGAGKTRLARWLMEMVRMGGYGGGMTALHQRSASTGHGLGGLVAEHLGCVGLPVDLLARRVKQLLDEEGANVGLEGRGLVALMDSGRKDDTGDETEFMLNPAAAVQVVRRVINRHAAREPVVVLVDDAQWGPDALSLTESILEHRDAPILLLLTVREESIDDFGLAQRFERLSERDDVVELPVHNLDRSGAQKLARESLSLNGYVADLIARTSQGNPLYATQLVQHWIQSGELELDGAEYVLATREPTVPAEMSGLWEETLNGLIARLSLPRMLGNGQIAIPASEETIRTRLEVAATLGVDVNEAEWRATCEALGTREVYGLVDELVDAGLALERESGFSFSHGLFRDAICDASRKSGRWETINKAAARVLEETYEARSMGVLPRLARHYLEAGSIEETQRLMAEELHRQGVFGYSPGGLYSELERVFVRLGVDLDDPRWIDFWMLYGESLSLQTDVGQNTRGRAMLRRAVEVAKSSNDPIKLGQALRFDGWCQLHGGDMKEGTEDLYRSVELLTGHSEESLSLTFLSLMLWSDGDFEAAYEAALQGLESASSPIQEFYAHQMLGHTASHENDYTQALVHLERCAEIADAYGMVDAMHAAMWSTGDVHFQLGEYEAAAEFLGEWVELSDFFGRSDRYAILGNEYLGRALALIGEYDEALRFLMRTFGAVQRGEGGFQVRPADAMLLCALGTENDALFEEVFEDAFTPAEDFEPSRYIPVVARVFELLVEREDARLARVIRSAKESPVLMGNDALRALVERHSG